MTARRPPSPAKSKKLSKSFPKRHWLLLVFGLVILGGLTVFFGLQIRTDRTIAADKARFAQAEKDIYDISAEIVATVGEPVKVTKDKSCSRPNLKFEDGPLSCAVSIISYHGIDSVSEATNRFKDISSTIQNGWTLSETEVSNNISGNRKYEFEELVLDYEPLRDSQQIFEKYDSHIKSMRCVSSYNLYPSGLPPYGNYFKNTNTTLALAHSIGCSGSSSRSIY